MREVQQYLLQLADLARMEADIMPRDSENAWLAIDKQIEQVLGDKERAIGALQEHRREHGC